MGAGLSRGYVKAFKAEAAISKRRIVMFGTTDDLITPATGSTSLAIGVTTEIDSAIGEVTDVVMSGLTDVEFGGTVTRGQYLTSDATGRAIAAAPAAGVNASIIGQAMVSAVVGDVGPALITQSRIQG